MGLLSGITVAVGVSGGIAAYKTCELVGRLRKEGADVVVMMTENAREFVTPLTFETLSANRVITDTFSRDFSWEVWHVSLAKRADLIVIAPATANIIAKLAAGIADDFVTTTALARRCGLLAAPAMNTAMLQNAVTQDNIKKLAGSGVQFIYGGEGRLACGDSGAGRMAEPEEIFFKIKELLLPDQTFKGKKAIITAGATSEDIDGVRCLTNYSSGKMGIALCEAFRRRGADCTLIAGHISVTPPEGIKRVDVKSTEDMYNAVMDNLPGADYVVKAAAPCDYVLADKPSGKIKGAEIVLKFTKAKDIAAAVGRKKGKTKLIIFCAETTDPIPSAKEKLASKNADMVIANDVTQQGAGFNCDTNIVTIITNKYAESLDKLSKTALSDIILDRIAKL
jgi:phosphopantothenoylcysteine decarboxylase/phosphopantothenate--cysteine ligase